MRKEVISPLFPFDYFTGSMTNRLLLTMTLTLLSTVKSASLSRFPHGRIKSVKNSVALCIV
jgi:hypothetical protein